MFRLQTLLRNFLEESRKKAPTELIGKIENAILTLRENPIPESLGTAKKGPLVGLFAYELDRENRLLYGVRRTGNECTVLLLRVCSQKEVYGKG
jgi:hypothetical protein